MNSVLFTGCSFEKLQEQCDFLTIFNGFFLRVDVFRARS